MKLADIKKKAKKLGVEPGTMKKPDLIRSIQNAEGNSPCFECISGCGQKDCCWWSDCQKQ